MNQATIQLFFVYSCTFTLSFIHTRNHTSNHTVSGLRNNTPVYCTTTNRISNQVHTEFNTVQLRTCVCGIPPTYLPNRSIFTWDTEPFLKRAFHTTPYNRRHLNEHSDMHSVCVQCECVGVYNTFLDYVSGKRK